MASSFTLQNVCEEGVVKMAVIESEENIRAGSIGGGIALSFSLVMTVVISVAKDLDDTHLFNPLWPPHARFHDAAMLNLLAGACAVALWLLWRKGKEPHIAAIVAGAMPIIFWSAFFWVSAVVPGASLHAVEGGPPTLVLGLDVPPNLIAAFVFVLISTFGLWQFFRAIGHR
jgi:hypothetical protein